jgi:hypothetical protein
MSGAGAVWQRARFGTVRPRVQIPGPRPISDLETVTQLEHILIAPLYYCITSAAFWKVSITPGAVALAWVRRLPRGPSSMVDSGRRSRGIIGAACQIRPNGASAEVDLQVNSTVCGRRIGADRPLCLTQFRCFVRMPR